MKKTTLLSTLVAAAMTATAAAPAQQGYPISPIAFTQVKVAENTFWGQRLKACRDVTVPLAFSKCEETGRYTNFENAAAHLKDPSQVFEIKQGTFSFDDTDPYKTIEGASYLLQTYPDMTIRSGLHGGKTVALQQYLDSVIAIIGAAQEPDGYLYTARTQNPQKPHGWAGTKRWEGEEWQSHELYDLGHMVEAAIAHYQATGKRTFLDIAIRYADCVCREVGPGQSQAHVVPGHQIAEMALAKLYLTTGDRKYLDEAKYFLDYRGKTKTKSEYSQSHLPVTEQKEAVGHAVRAGYMYAGMADVAALTGDTTYVQAIDSIWENIVHKKLYITGGVGATGNGEAFGKNYELPNATAYCETCAAIANVYLNYRLFLLHGESKYFDVLERTLYNALIAGMSLDGGTFFYPNPLASDGGYARQPWFGCACCPSNLSRFIPSLPGYAYAVKEKEGKKGVASLYVNLFMANEMTTAIDGKSVRLSQQTDYPTSGTVRVTIDENRAGRFQLKLRIPGWAWRQVVPWNPLTCKEPLYTYDDRWATSTLVYINGEPAFDIDKDARPTDDGYYTMTRNWKAGDVIEMQMDMPVRQVKANDRVAADRGQIAVERGPLVYCAEQLLDETASGSTANNPFDLELTILNQQPQFTLGQATIAGTPVTTLTTQAQSIHIDDRGRLAPRDEQLTLIPYYAWCHRGNSKMRVWLPKIIRRWE